MSVMWKQCSNWSSLHYFFFITCCHYGEFQSKHNCIAESISEQFIFRSLFLFSISVLFICSEQQKSFLLLHFELIFLVVLIVCKNKPYQQRKTFIVNSLICALQQINGNSNATTNHQLTVRCYVWKHFSCAANTVYSSQVVYANK